MMGAGNQQESLDAKWIVGFVDGEGCFTVAIYKSPDRHLKWRVQPEFIVAQHERDEELLCKLKDYFEIGKVKVLYNGKHGALKAFRVRGMSNLSRVVKFFEMYPLRAPSKRRSFEIFASILEMMNHKEHLTRDGFNKIAKMASEMNHASRILRDFMPDAQKGEDKVRPPQRCGEAGRNDQPAFERRS